MVADVDHPVSVGRKQALDLLFSFVLSKFSPPDPVVLKEFSTTGNYNSGVFWAFDVIIQKWVSFSAHDHGQYPWGRDRNSGALASLCKLLGIVSSDNVRNCCLFVHLLMAILEAHLFSVDDLFNSFEPLLRKFLVSNTMRTDIEVVPEFLDTLKIRHKIYVRFIFLHDDGIFYLCSEFFGNPKAHGILLAYSKSHFFLARPYAAPR